MQPIHLPNLNEYKEQFQDEGVCAPLRRVPFFEDGLLSRLPAPKPGRVGWPWTEETPSPESSRTDWPKLSIVTPSFNQGQFIEETIRSVLLQNYPNLEYIVCDGGSTDETESILRKYSPWLSYYHIQKDRGQGHALNLGFSLSTGDYFGWLNSDDFYLPGAFVALATVIKKNPADFMYGDALILEDKERRFKYWRGYLVRDRYLYLGGLIASHAAFWRNSVHLPVCEDLYCAMDYELWLRLLPGKSRKHIRRPLGVFRIQSGSKSTHNQFRDLWQKDEERIVSAYGPLVRRHSLRSYELHLVQRIYRRVVSPWLNFAYSKQSPSLDAYLSRQL